MPIRILVNGSRGKVGSLIVKAVNQDRELTLVAATDIEDNLRSALAQHNPDVAVDFTRASSGYENALTIIEAGVRPVIGTSGFVSEQVFHLQELSSNKRLGGVVAPNFSISAVLMMKFAQQAAKYLPQVEIIELHHDAKEEAPSGTALRTAELIQAGRINSEAAHQVTQSYEIIPHVRGGKHCDVNIHSVRLPGLVAHQEVIFGSLAQTLTIRSDTTSREAFIGGVILACKRVMEVNSLYYGLEHLL